jgi:hypothetical protein
LFKGELVKFLIDFVFVKSLSKFSLGAEEVGGYMLPDFWSDFYL